MRAMFTRIAPYYDLLNTLLSAGLHYHWRRRAAAMASLKPGHIALDVATGTGDFALELWRHVGPSGTVVAVDFSWGMLQAARSKLRSLGCGDHIHLVKADALKLPFPDATFHSATVGFAGRNVTDLHTLFSEMNRVVRPGGKVVFLELGVPRKPLIGQLFGLYFRRLAPIIGRIVSRDAVAYSYLPASVYAFPDPQTLASIMREAGLTDVHFRLLALGIATIHVGTATSSGGQTVVPKDSGAAPT